MNDMNDRETSINNNRSQSLNIGIPTHTNGGIKQNNFNKITNKQFLSAVRLVSS